MLIGSVTSLVLAVILSVGTVPSLQTIKKHWRTKVSPDTPFDYNHDGKINNIDFAHMAQGLDMYDPKYWAAYAEQQRSKISPGYRILWETRHSYAPIPVMWYEWEAYWETQ